MSDLPIREDYERTIAELIGKLARAERERDAALEQRDIWQEHHCCAVRERDEAREALIAIERSGLGSTARTIARAALSPTQPKGGE